MKSLISQKKISKGKYFLFAALSVVIVFLLWSAVSYSGIIRPIFLPTPTATLKATVKLFQEFGLLEDIGISVYRIFLGFIFSCIIAVPLGIWMGINKKLEAFFDPIVGFTRYIPPSAFVPLFILWFGIGDFEKILLIFAGTTPYLAVLVFDVVANTKREFIEAGYTLGAKGKDILKKIIVPQSLPGIWDAMRVVFGLSWTLLVVAEIVASTSGLGHLIITSQRFLKTPNVIAAILIISILGILTDYIFKITYKIFFPWTEKSTHA